MSDPPRTRMVAGAMSGTSLDAIDAALVRIEGQGLEMQVEVVNTLSYPMRSLGKMLRPVTTQRRQTAEQVAKASMMLGLSHAVLLSKLVDSTPLDLIAVHGQTVYHEGAVSMQLINPHPIVRELGVPVVYDLRGADIAAGGHGAPITPLADHILFRDDQETRAVVNLGGFANFTWLPPSQRSGDAARSSIRGGDICACNQILDAVARRAFRRKYDRDGGRALKGEVDAEARKILVGLLSAQVEGSGSLGTGDELIDWVNMFRDEHSGEDLARTGCSAIAQVISGAVGEADRLILAGGGCYNRALVQEIADQSDASVCPSDDFAIPVQYREAIGMAVLGALCEDRVPITLPQVTGCTEAPVAGAWVYPP